MISPVMPSTVSAKGSTWIFEALGTSLGHGCTETTSPMRTRKLRRTTLFMRMFLSSASFSSVVSAMQTVSLRFLPNQQNHHTRVSVFVGTQGAIVANQSIHIHVRKKSEVSISRSSTTWSGFPQVVPLAAPVMTLSGVCHHCSSSAFLWSS